MIVWIGLIPTGLAQAYTDPGTGAMLWQVLTGMLIGVGFHVRRFINGVAGSSKKKID